MLDPFPSLADLPPVRSSDGRAAVADEMRRRAAEHRGYEEGRRAGFEQGVFEGRSRGAREAREEAADRFESLLGGIEQAMLAVRRNAGEQRRDLSDEVAALALSIAEAVIGRAVDLGVAGGREAIARAIAAAPDSGTMTARLHPADLLELGAGELDTGGRELQLVADPTLRPGDCVLDAGATRVDATLTGALDRVRRVLRSEGAAAKVLDGGVGQ